jgi:hypothetical protein
MAIDLNPTVPVLSAIAGAGIALVGTVLSNRRARERQLLDLQHQAEQKEKERQHALKRDVYIPLAEATASAMSFIGQIASAPSEAVQKMEAVNALTRQVARATFVAPRAVMEPLQLGLRCLATNFMDLLKERMRIDLVSAQIANIDITIQSHSARQSTLQDRLDKQLDSGTPNAEI